MRTSFIHKINNFVCNYVLISPSKPFTSQQSFDKRLYDTHIISYNSISGTRKIIFWSFPTCVTFPTPIVSKYFYLPVMCIQEGNGSGSKWSSKAQKIRIYITALGSFERGNGEKEATELYTICRTMNWVNIDEKYTAVYERVPHKVDVFFWSCFVQSCSSKLNYNAIRKYINSSDESDKKFIEIKWKRMNFMMKNFTSPSLTFKLQNPRVVQTANLMHTDHVIPRNRISIFWLCCRWVQNVYQSWCKLPPHVISLHVCCHTSVETPFKLNSIHELAYLYKVIM